MALPLFAFASNPEELPEVLKALREQMQEKVARGESLTNREQAQMAKINEILEEQENEPSNN